MRVAIVGGRLQGIEAAYLCSKAGYETVLIDRDPDSPAKGLTDEFHAIDLFEKPEKAKHVLRACDAVLPTNEDRKVLAALEKLCNELDIPFMQDNAAFWMTSDKARSMDFFHKWGIPTPKAWPESGFPVIVKPSGKSGSESVFRADSRYRLEETLKIVRKIDPNPIVQDFIEGPALSLEVLSGKGVGEPLQITGLEFDESYGCKRVCAPVEVPPEVKEGMKVIGTRIALKLGLNGLTDVQALLKGSNLKVNEINARLPSQTPTVVYHSTGINMGELLVKLFVEGRLMHVEIHSERAVLYQHVKVFGKELRVQGEHVMANAVGLRAEEGFLGADESITNLELGADATNRVATLIVKSRDIHTALKKMREVIENIMIEYRLKQYTDPSPTRGNSF
jgi:pyrrolysine biosynthesis protein PylC